jgi:trimeric autotransporter adhesin
VVPLTGTGGTDYAVSASPSSNTITAGQTATYTLTVSPMNSFNQVVALSCSGAPLMATCSISPASVSPNGMAPSTTTMSITTTARSVELFRPAEPWSRSRARWQICIVILLWLVALLQFAEAGRRRKCVSVGVGATFVAIFLALVLAACGGGSTGGGSAGTAHGSSTITVTSTSGTLSHSTTVTLQVN